VAEVAKLANAFEVEPIYIQRKVYMARPIYIVGNWKMHMLSEEADLFIQEIVPLLNDTTCKVYLAPPYTSIEAARHAAEGSCIRIGAQNMNEYPKGAYTGEISSTMLKDVGAQFVILGHSERRQIFKEDDQMIHRKVKWAVREKLQPILCIGETREEREANLTHTVLERQLGEGLGELDPDELTSLIVAYEPVWAIGTGKTATPQMAQEAHEICRKFISQKVGQKIAEMIPILYGGSVKPENTADLIKQRDIDGALVGGASLKVDSFAKIVQYAEEAKG
jgi:triosephosphate isomerase